jgi:hypothetical protein
MPGFMPGIHAFATLRKQDVDGRAFSAKMRFALSPGHHYSRRFRYELRSVVAGRCSRVRSNKSVTVMPGFMPGIHVFATLRKQDVDGRAFSAKTRFALSPGHDDSIQGASAMNRGQFCPGTIFAAFTSSALRARSLRM